LNDFRKKVCNGSSARPEVSDLLTEDSQT
jgi:hypothetical protein